MAKDLARYALEYLERGYSVIPVGHDKIPLIKWEKYQKEKASKKEVLEWWIKWPDANIGVVTGQLSDLVGIDIDNPNLKNEILDEAERLLNPPVSVTPRGGRHMYFKYRHEVRNATAVIPGVDIRGEGGYVVVPPSMNGTGIPYVWHNSSILSKSIPSLPDAIYTMYSNSFYLRENAPKNDEIRLFPEGNPEDEACKQYRAKRTNAYGCFQLLTEGRRDEDLFHIANCMVKGGAKYDEMCEVIERLASTCEPPFPAKEALSKVESALNRADRKERSVAEDVRNFCAMQEGFFLVQDVCNALTLKSRTEKNAAYISLNRLVKDGIIEKYGKKSGCYRVVDRDVEEMNWENAPTQDIQLTWPLSLEDYVKIYPTNVCVIAGASNSGKTTFALDFARRNCGLYKINYFNSEMGAAELRMRLELFENTEKATWKRIRFVERADNFDDVVMPDEINIIDYMEVLDEFWKVGEQIKNIWSRLNKGIAIIALQKNVGATLGRGGALGTEKPRMYLAMDYGKIKIVKAKNWRATENPNNLICEFFLAGGYKFIPKKEPIWQKEGI